MTLGLGGRRRGRKEEREGEERESFQSCDVCVLVLGWLFLLEFFTEGINV